MSANLSEFLKENPEVLNENGKAVICCIEPKFVKVKTAERIFSRSHNNIMSEAAEAGAIVRLGRSVIIDVKKLELYYSALAGGV